MKKPMRADPEQKYRTLYELTSDAVMLLDEQSFFDCNPATLKMFGCATREQFLGKHPSEFSPEFQPSGQTSAGLSQQHITTALREGTCRFEWQHCRLDGAEFPAEVWLTAMDLSGEKVLQAVVRDITERKRAEAALRESEEKFRSVVENAPIGIFTVDNAFKFIYANDELCGVVDYTREEIIGRNFLEFLDEESQQTVADRYVRRQRGEDVPDRYEFNVVRKDGEKRRVEIRSTVIQDSAGNVQTIGQILDITERKRAQETLQESEQRFRTLAEAPFEGIALSEKGVFVDLNGRLASMLGYARNELIGKPLWETVAPESRELVAEAIRSGRTEPYEHFARRKDGTTFPVEVRAGITQMADRELRVTAIRDITERKRAEEALRESEEKYRTILDNIEDSYYEVDIAGNLTFFNDSLCRLYGYSKDELMGMNYRQYMDDETAKTVYQTYNTVFHTRNPSGVLDWEAIRKDGTRRFVQVSISLMRGPTGEPIGFRGIVRDIAERKQAEEALRESQQLIQTVMDNIPQSIFWKDKNLVYLGCNRAFAADAGLASPSDALGKTDWDMPWKEQAQLYRADDRRVMESGVPKLNYEEPQTTPDSSTIWLRTSKVPMRDADGNVTAVLGMYEDITERKRAEEVVAQERNLLRTLIDNLPDFIYVKDTNSRFTLGNHAIARRMGVTTPDELAGKSDADWYPQELAAQYCADEQAIMQSGQPLIDHEEPNLDEAGNTTWVLTTKVPLRDSQGKVVGLVGIGRDITERKRAEEESHVARQRLLDIIDFLPDATFVIDRDKKVIAWNRAAEEMTGTRKEDILGQGDYAYAVPWWGERRPMVVDLIGMEESEFRAKYDFVQKIGSNTLYAEVFVPRVFGGRGGYMAATAAPLLDSAGNMVGAIESVRDVTERKRLDDELRAAQRQLTDIIDFLPDATFVIDQDKKVIAWNRAAEEMTGTRKEDILGQGDYAYAIPWWGERRPMVVDLIGMEESEFRTKYDFVQKIGSNTLYAEVFVPRVFGGRGGYMAATAAPLLDSAGNMVGAIESVRDVTERKRLEQQIQESLARRGVQVQTSTEVAQEIAAAPALDELLRRVVTLVKERFGYYHTQIFRHEPSLSAVVLVSGYGEVGQKMLAAGHRLAMGRGVVGTAAATGQAVLASNVTQDKDWRPNPNLPDTKGELAVPIKLRSQVLGILDVQSDRAGALTAEDQLLLEGLCGQIAVAMEGTRLRQETEERLRELTTLYRATSREGWEAFRQAAELPIGYLFNRTIIQPAEDLWMPEIAKAVEQSALVSPAPSPVAAPKAQESPNASATVAPLSVRGEVVGALGVYDDPQRPMSPDDLALVESVSEQVAQALENARLFDESKRARLLLDKRVRGLDCLNDIGLKLEESVSMPNFLQWVAERIPAVMQYPDLCVAAIEYGGQVYGAPEALTLPRQMVQGLRRGGELIGRVCIAYTQEHDFLDEESALLGDIARRVNAYLENQRLLSETQARARREQVLREITARVRSSTDPDAVMRALVQELGTALGRSTFARLGSAEELSEPKAHRGQALVTPSARGNGDPSSAGG